MRGKMLFDDTAKNNDVISFLLFLASSLTWWCVEFNASDVVIAEGVEVEPMSVCCVVADGMAVIKGQVKVKLDYCEYLV